jgi:hypothetical protein
MEGKMRKVVDVAYPGQSEKVRVGLGVKVLRAYNDGTIEVRFLTWRDRPYPEPTLQWEEFYKKYRGHPAVERGRQI